LKRNRYVPENEHFIGIVSQQAGDTYHIRHAETCCILREKMKLFLQSAAVLLCSLLMATPVFAAVPCIGSGQSAPECALCCQEMAGTQTMAAVGLAAHIPAADLTCCQSSTGDAANAADAWESLGTVPAQSLRSSVVGFAPAISPGHLRKAVLFSDRLQHDRVYSILCTFLI
jgi:hypothetical protein